MLEYIEKLNKPQQKAEYAIIWLHGLGADANDFVPLIPELKLDHSVKFIFPNAPLRPITINNGYVMRGWYDLRNLNSLRDDIDVSGILATVKAVEELIELQLKSGINPDKIILAGFSQGGVIAYVTAIMTKYKLAGVIALSCYLPEIPYDLIGSTNKNIPIFAAHGAQDNVVPLIAGTNAYDKLKTSGFNIKWHEYPMPHSVCAEEITDISNWFSSHLFL